jgi:release factor glutamine methyltransferase
MRKKTVSETLREATAQLRSADVDSPRLDAELLLAHALGGGATRERLVTGREDPVPPKAAAAFRALIERRAQTREPVAYLLGRRAFRRIELLVDPRVLIPRPETELLVELALELPPGTRVHEVGTGSGAIVLALADERPDLILSASDVSAGALEVATTNARRLGLGPRLAVDAAGPVNASLNASLNDVYTTGLSDVYTTGVALLQADLLEGLPYPPLPVDVVLANLPYVREDERATLPPEVREHEPASALFAGADGLDLIRRLIAQSAAAGVALLALEHGQGQAPAVEALLSESGYGEVHRHRDLAGTERVVVARRRGRG